MNVKTYIEFDRFEMDRSGRKVPIWRKRQVWLIREEVRKAKEVKEKMNIVA